MCSARSAVMLSCKMTERNQRQYLVLFDFEPVLVGLRLVCVGFHRFQCCFFLSFGTCKSLGKNTIILLSFFFFSYASNILHENTQRAFCSPYIIRIEMIPKEKEEEKVLDVCTLFVNAFDAFRL